MVAALRGEIHAGVLAPGQRLPSRVELKERFGTTLLTVQRAMMVLAQEGYVRPVDRSGTFVADNPPHISHYALVFPVAEDLRRSQFYFALRNEALILQRPHRVSRSSMKSRGTSMCGIIRHCCSVYNPISSPASSS